MYTELEVLYRAVEDFTTKQTEKDAAKAAKDAADAAKLEADAAAA